MALARAFTIQFRYTCRAHIRALAIKKGFSGCGTMWPLKFCLLPMYPQLGADQQLQVVDSIFKSLSTAAARKVQVAVSEV